jgi:hypothetical protein
MFIGSRTVRVDSGPTLPNVADANARLSLTAEGVVVSGAGATAANKTFTQRGMSNGKPFYNIASNPDNATHHAISWDGTQWNMLTQGGSGGGRSYYSTEDVDRPDLVVTWVQDVGGSPLPTVTHSPGQVTGAGYQVTQDDEGNAIVHTLNGDGADADAGLWVDGVAYSPRGTNEGKNYYNIVGQPDDPTLSAIVWADDGHGGFVWKNIDSSGGISDSGPDDVEFPWLSSAWAFPPQRNPIAGPANWTP